MRSPLAVSRRLPLAGPRLMLVAVHVPVIAEAPLFVINGALGGIPPSRYPWLAALSAAMIFCLQLRHSLALARGERPRGGVWTLLALAALAYAPMHWLGLNWITEQAVLIASVPMVLSARLAAAVLAGPAAYEGLEWARVFPDHPGAASTADYVYWLTYYAATSVVIPAALYASARLVRVAGELRDARIALAGTEVARERLRVSRDLHDLLGHSLSAVSLKGDLAARLLRRDEPGAMAEIHGLTDVARKALAGLRAITAGGLEVTLAGELGSARAVLAAAGVTVRVRGDLSAIPPAAGQALAWVVREGTTNILRHATAASTVITLGREDGMARLEIVNDGVHSPAGTGGYGLEGLAARIREQSGTVTHERLDGDRFLLAAQIPVAGSEESHWTASGCSSPKTST